MDPSRRPDRSDDLTALEELKRHYRARDLAARRWKADGGKVVGYFCEVVPEELIIAAGFLPYRISGDPTFRSEALEKYVHPFAPKAFSAGRDNGAEFVSSMCALLLMGKYNFVDYLVVPHTRKSILMIETQLREAKATYPELVLPELYILDRALTPYLSSSTFNRDRLIDFKNKLEEWSGRSMNLSCVIAAIVACNESRDVLGQVAASRAAPAPRFSGTDALQVFGSSKFMPKADHTVLTRRAIDEALAPSTGKRIFVGGSPQDNLQLYDIIESRGGIVVAEDHCWGNRCADMPVSTSGDPFDAVIERYGRMPGCTLTYPLAKTVERSAQRAAAAKAQGAVFSVYEGDIVQLWETPDEIAAVRGLGIPALYLKEQHYKLSDPAAVGAEVERFISGL